MTFNSYMTYNPDEWYENPIVGGQYTTPGQLGYYLGWLENLSWNDLQEIIQAKSNQKEIDLWQSMPVSYDSRLELVGIILCKYSPQDFEEAITQWREKHKEEFAAE